MTPARFSSSLSCANLFNGPRILYEPVRWNDSALSSTSKPVTSPREREVSRGVRWAWAPTCRCASRNVAVESSAATMPDGDATRRGPWRSWPHHIFVNRDFKVVGADGDVAGLPACAQPSLQSVEAMLCSPGDLEDVVGLARVAVAERRADAWLA